MRKRWDLEKGKPMKLHLMKRNNGPAPGIPQQIPLTEHPKNHSGALGDDENANNGNSSRANIGNNVSKVESHLKTPSELFSQQIKNNNRTKYGPVNDAPMQETCTNPFSD